jgi:PRC-barrel domain protein
MANEDRDRVSIRTDADTGGTLVHTKDLDDFKLPNNEPDPRGWDVRGTDGSKVGKVEDLLFDTGERRIRYLEVALDKDFAKDAARDYALVPFGQARLDDDNDHVVVDLSSTDLAYADERYTARGSREQSGAADRATRGGIADRVTDAADNVKDRIDGNPASRPGPDPTDRRI